MNRQNLRFLPALIIGIILLWVACSDDEDDNGTGGTTAFSVLSVGPADGTDSVASDAEIWATFSRVLDSGSVTSAAFYVTAGSDTVDGEILVTGQTATLTPTFGLDRSTTYTAHATTAIRDENGNALPQGESWSFSTVPLETIEWMGSFATPGVALSVVVEESFAFVADASSGLQVVLANPTDPMFARSYDSVASTGGLAVEGSYAYICGSLDGGGPSNGLHVLDLSYRPDKRVGSLEGFGWIPDLVVDGVYVYLADYDVGMHVVSVFDPSAPTLLTTETVLGSPRGVDVDGSYAYLATEWTEWAEWQGLHVFDVANPLEPNLVSSLATPDRALAVHVVAGYAYIAADSAGLRIVDITQPATPEEVGRYTVDEASAMDVFVSGDYAFVADFRHGVQVFDVSVRETPGLVATYDTPGSARDIFFVEPYIFVADYDGGLQILRFNPN